jgi:hypothetical protein
VLLLFIFDVGTNLYKKAQRTPNVAARVQALAEPGTVVVTERVQHQVAGLLFSTAASTLFGIKGACPHKP